VIGASRPIRKPVVRGRPSHARSLDSVLLSVQCGHSTSRRTSVAHAGSRGSLPARTRVVEQCLRPGASSCCRKPALLARLGQMRLNVARQMFEQWPARCLFRYRERCVRNFNWRRAFVGFELFESQFELLDLPVQSLGLAPELHAAQLPISSFKCSISASPVAMTTSCASTTSAGVQSWRRERSVPSRRDC